MSDVDVLIEFRADVVRLYFVYHWRIFGLLKLFIEKKVDPRTQRKHGKSRTGYVSFVRNPTA